MAVLAQVAFQIMLNMLILFVALCGVVQAIFVIENEVLQ